MKVVKKVVLAMIIAIMIPILIVSVVILFDSYMHPNEIPGFLGWKPFIVISDTMEDTIKKGDIVVVKKVDPTTVKEGDIIAFNKNGSITTHRISRKEKVESKTLIYTKGDKNEAEDNWTVTFREIEGVYKFKVSGLGKIALFVQTPTGIGACLAIPLVILIMFQIMAILKEMSREENEKSEIEELKKEIERLKKVNEDLSKTK